MCTVVYIPMNDTCYFASLRDESPARASAKMPQLMIGHDVDYIAPIDPLSNGTWLGINARENVIILLNGAFTAHQKKSNYRKSRGVIVNELVQSAMPIIEWRLMNLEGIEPFTLVVWSNPILFELVWDGVTKHKNMIDHNIPHIWSSSTLYNSQANQKRKDWFQNWIKHQEKMDSRSLFKFFTTQDDLENGFIINRNESIKTLSYSFIEVTKRQMASLEYCDLQSDEHQRITIKFNQNFCAVD